jgi:hypothetical protein
VRLAQFNSTYPILSAKIKKTDRQKAESNIIHEIKSRTSTYASVKLDFESIMGRSRAS